MLAYQQIKKLLTYPSRQTVLIVSMPVSLILCGGCGNSSKVNFSHCRSSVCRRFSIINGRILSLTQFLPPPTEPNMYVGVKRYDPTVESNEQQEEPIAKRQKVDNGDDYVADVAVEEDPKYKGIMKKFKAVMEHAVSKQTTAELAEDNEQEQEEELEQHELGPLPQPKVERTGPRGIGRLLPKWMAEPVYVDVKESKPFRKFELSDRMIKVLKSQGWESAFAVQTAVLPEVLKDLKQIAPDALPDVLVNAETGSGKTLAYSIPIVEGLSTRVVPQIRALVVLPTRPLMQQVFKVMETIAKGTSLRVMMLRTDRAFKEEQTLLERSTPDILITTPGRLVDHIRQTETFTLRHIRFFVIDEADRLLNQSFQEWVDIVMDAMPVAVQDQSEVWARPVQKMVFSATLTRDPGKLASLKIGSDPRIFVVGDKEHDQHEFSVPQQLTEKTVPVNSLAKKPLKVVQLLKHCEIKEHTIVFVKSNEAAGRLARLMSLIDQNAYNGDLVIERCSGEMELKQRKKVLRQFSEGEIGILVCTDLIARGIDIAGIENVINYDLPIGKREYVHRVGRTARAGQSGTAFNLICSKGEYKHFWSMARSIYRGDKEIVNEKLDAETEDMTTGYEKSLEQLENEVFNRV